MVKRIRGVRPPSDITVILAVFCRYFLLVTVATSFVMVIVHDRVPDMEKYPPLPDFFLDNIPLIPWAFDLCEVAGFLLAVFWTFVLVFHKHRFDLRATSHWQKSLNSSVSFTGLYYSDVFSF